MANFFVITAILISLYSVFLKITNKNETNLFDNVSMKVLAPEEYDSEGKFWWLVEGNNSIVLTNYSNEQRSIELNIQFENNPCKTSEFLIIEGIDKINIMNDSFFVKKYTLNPFESKLIKIESTVFKSCKVKGDSRIFGSKLRHWYVR